MVSPTTTSPPCCKELADVECRLETKDLWDKFHELGTEMIITKTGRYVHVPNYAGFPTACIVEILIIDTIIIIIIIILRTLFNEET